MGHPFGLSAGQLPALARGNVARYGRSDGDGLAGLAPLEATPLRHPVDGLVGWQLSRHVDGVSVVSALLHPDTSTVVRFGGRRMADSAATLQQPEPEDHSRSIRVCTVPDGCLWFGSRSLSWLPTPCRTIL